MSSSSTMPPPVAPSNRGRSASDGQASAKSRSPAWPLPRGPALAESTSATERRAQSAERPVQLPRSGAPRATDAQPRPSTSRGLPFEQGVAVRFGAAGNAPQPAEEEIPILVPAALNTRRPQGGGRVPPPIVTRSLSEQVVPSFSFPRPPLRMLSEDVPSVNEPRGQRPLRNGAPAPAPGQLVTDTSRQGLSRLGQDGFLLLPELPGSAATPTKSPQHMNVPISLWPRERDLPPPMRVGNTQTNASQWPNVAPSAAVQSQMQPVMHQAEPPRPAAAQQASVSGPYPGQRVQAGVVHPFAGKLANPSALSPPKPTNPPRSSPPGLPSQQGEVARMDPLRSSPPNPPLQPGNPFVLDPSVYRPSRLPSPPRRQDTANLAPARGGSPPRPIPQVVNPSQPIPVSRGASPPRPGLRMASPPRPKSPPNAARPPVISAPVFAGPRPRPTYPGPSHGHSHSLDSNVSNDSTTSSSTLASTKPLNPLPRQNTAGAARGGFPARQDSDLSSRGKGTSAVQQQQRQQQQTPYMNMLLSLDKIPRLHNILVSVFMWVLLAGFVILPGSFTSTQHKPQDGQTTISLPGTKPDKQAALTPSNTAALVVGVVCLAAGTLGSAALALRWRRNYVWLLNKLYLPLVFNALAGVLATVTGVYTQQGGEWSAQAVVAIVLEATVLGVGLGLFFVYNHWLLRRVRSEYEEQVGGGSEKMGQQKSVWVTTRRKKRGGFFARIRRARREPPIAAGSVV